MSRRKVLWITGALVFLAICASLYTILGAQHNHFSVLNPYMIQSTSIVMHGPQRVNVVKGKITVEKSTYVHFSMAELARISPDEAWALILRECPESDGWTLSVHGQTKSLCKGETTINIMTGRASDNPKASATVMETTPTSKSEQVIIDLLRRVGVRLAR